MNKVFSTLSFILLAGTVSVKAQSIYRFNGTWLDLETLTRADTIPENVDSLNYKKLSKYASRFNVVSLCTDAPKEAAYANRPFKIEDDAHISFHIPPGGKEVSIETNKGDDALDNVPGNDFIVAIPDGVIHVQRFEGKAGYRITKLDERGRTQFRQNLQHTIVTPIQGKDEDFKTPYLFYFLHTDRFMAFTSAHTHSIHKTVIMDLKDGKIMPIESTICGVIRSENEQSFRGYIVRDDVAKTMKVAMHGISWALKDNNITKLVVEAVVSDSVLILARYHQGGATVSLVAFQARTGKPVWSGEVKQSTAATNAVALSIYKNRLMMEVAQPTSSYLQVFDLATGKRAYSTL